MLQLALRHPKGGALSNTGNIKPKERCYPSDRKYDAKGGDHRAGDGMHAKELDNTVNCDRNLRSIERDCIARMLETLLFYLLLAYSEHFSYFLISE